MVIGHCGLYRDGHLSFPIRVDSGQPPCHPRNRYRPSSGNTHQSVCIYPGRTRVTQHVQPLGQVPVILDLSPIDCSIDPWWTAVSLHVTLRTGTIMLTHPVSRIGYTALTLAGQWSGIRAPRPFTPSPNATIQPLHTNPARVDSGQGSLSPVPSTLHRGLPSSPAALILGGQWSGLPVPGPSRPFTPAYRPALPH